MAIVKTTVSIPEKDFEYANQLAKEFGAPRSAIIAIALAEHLLRKRLRAEGEEEVTEDMILDRALQMRWLTPQHVTLARRINHGMGAA